MANLRRSLVITFFSSSGATLLKFIVSVLLARILSPSEIGVFSMTVVFVNLAHVFRDFGVTTYLQREADLTPEKIRSAIGVVYATSWAIGIAMYLASDWVGRWFGEPAIVPVMEILAIGFFIIPFGTVTNALMSREFQADKQAWVNAAGTISYCVCCVLLAKLGFGSTSLAWGNLANVLACALAYIPLRPKNMPWLPGFRHWRSVAHFGLGSLMSSSVRAVNNALPDVLLGKLGNAHQVGLLSRSNGTVSIFSHVAGSTVTYGAVSYMAQAYHRGESLVPVLCRANMLLTGIGWPALALTTVFGHEIVLALYGPTWLDCVPSILPLSMAAALAMMFHYIPLAVTAIGRPYLSAWPIVVTLAARIGFAVALYDGSVTGFAWALFLATAATAPILAGQQRRHCGLSVGMMLRSMLPSATVTLGTTVAGMLFNELMPGAIGAPGRLLLAAPLLALTWYLLLRLTRHALVGEIHRLAAPVRTRLASLFANS